MAARQTQSSDYSDVIRPTKNGVLIDIELTPGAVRAGVKGYNPWRQRIMIKVSAPARKGKANMELLSLLSTILDLDLKHLRIIKGERSTQKTIEAIGIGQDKAIGKLSEALNE